MKAFSNAPNVRQRIFGTSQMKTLRNSGKREYLDLLAKDIRKGVWH